MKYIFLNLRTIFSKYGFLDYPNELSRLDKSNPRAKAKTSPVKVISLYLDRGSLR